MAGYAGADITYSGVTPEWIEVSMRDSQLGIGVVGYGYWGPNLVRNFSINPAARVVSVSDLDPGRLGAIRQIYPGYQPHLDMTIC